MTNYITDTELNNTIGGPIIFTISDIHTDIFALIIELRDCAKVIRKKGIDIYNPNILDQELEDFLNIDISEHDNGYPHDLNYEWTAVNTHIVIVGDMLDGSRGYKKFTKKIKYGDIIPSSNNAPIHEYLQIEIKLLLFINALNRQAYNYHSKIYKLFGNHELSNILFDKEPFSSYYKSQIFDTASENECRNIYYRGYTRYDIFLPKNPGYNLLLEGGCGILLKLNNNIFVHGALQPIHISYINYINNKINNPETTIYRLRELFNMLTESGPVPINKLLWEYSYGQALGKIYYNGDRTMTCNRIIQDLQIFMDCDDVEHLRVIVGHCSQYINRGQIVSAYNKIESTDQISETLYNSNTGIQSIYGITMDCQQTPIENDTYSLYRVDVGAGRSQDTYKILDEETLLSRLPHILKIDGNTIRVIRSTLINMVIHLPRKDESYNYAIRTKINNEKQKHIPNIKTSNLSQMDFGFF